MEGGLGSGVLGLAERGAEGGALEGLSVECHGGLEPRGVVGAFSYARVGRQAEAAPLRQLLQLVLVHLTINDHGRMATISRQAKVMMKSGMNGSQHSEAYFAPPPRDEDQNDRLLIQRRREAATVMMMDGRDGGSQPPPPQR